jgi:DNA-binding GntR family transcriptional regulator
MRPAPRGATVDQVYERLRELIIDGHYPPGQRLTQQELSDEHHVGRTPLREALRLLQADGYLVAEANRGVRVAPVDVSHAEELYALRLLIEPPLLWALTPSFSTEDLAKMRKAVDAMESDSRVKAFQESHLELHLIALERYGEATRDIVLDLYRQTQRLQRLYMSRPRVTQEVVDIDRHIVAAVEERDGEQAKRLMQLHLLDWAVGLILDVDPDCRFDVLATAAIGVGLRLVIAPGEPVRAPLEVKWPRGGSARLPATSNIVPV